jgi:septal ring factor EnvC (AmiA/AmiB activator)
MDSLFSGPPKQDNSAAEARAAAEAEAQREKEELERKKREEESALRRGLRGRRALFSNEGGELGFPMTLG